MARIRLIHWNATEAAERRALLAALGHEVVPALPAGPDLMREARSAPPDVYVIDLSRLPSQGRDVALSLRSTAAARRTPLVLVGGDPAKTARTKELLPDAIFTGWDGIAPALQQALSQPVAASAHKLSSFAAYAGRPLPTKLGIKPGAVVALMDSPEGFVATLGEVPQAVRFVDGVNSECALVLWFVRSRAALQNGIVTMAEQIGVRPLWIVWPKKASGVQTDVTQQTVRDMGLAHGLVDYKIAAIDNTWSGLLFRIRKVS